jgi:hypothetical protein
MAEKLVRDIHSSPLQTFVNYGSKEFYKIGLVAEVVTHFTAVIYEWAP